MDKHKKQEEFGENIPQVNVTGPSVGNTFHWTASHHKFSVWCLDTIQVKTKHVLGVITQIACLVVLAGVDVIVLSLLPMVS